MENSEDLREIGRLHALESWRNMLGSGRLNSWIRDTRNRSVDFHLDLVIRLLAAERADRSIKVLDVGSGPISMLSNNHKGWNIELYAADALGGQDYDDLLDELGIDTEHTLVRPMKADCESLSSVVGEGAFDLVFMRNALDHTLDPVRSYSELLNSTAPGGYVLIEQFEKEAIAEKWEGFHQWNIWFKDGTIMVEGRETDAVDLLASARLANQVIDCWRTKRINGKPWCGALVKRR